MWHDFKTAYRENCRQTRLPGAVLNTLLLMETLCARFVLYGAMQASALLYAGLIMGFLLLFVVWHFFTMQMLFLSLSTRDAMQNSVLLLFGHVWRTLPAACCWRAPGGRWFWCSALAQLRAAVRGRAYADYPVGRFPALARDGEGVFHHAAPEREA